MADQEIMAPVPASGNQPPLQQFNSLRFGMPGFASQPAVRKALPALGLAGAGALAFAAWWAVQSPAQTPLFPGLPDADKSAIVEALQSSGINYTIDTATGSVTVAEADASKAKIMLAGQGLPKSAPAGGSMIASMPMGTSRAVEGETLRSARAADLGRTIEAIDAVKSARVHLAVSEPSVFVRDTVAPAASVMLVMQPGRSLSETQVRAIRHLIASSVPGMSPDQVSIVDQSGALLSHRDGGSEDASFQRQLDVENRYRQALISLLTPVLGRENFAAEIHADLDFTESQSTRESYPKDERALRREEGNKTEAVSPQTAIGIPGALSNQPPQATQATNQNPQTAQAGGASGTQTAETYARSFEVGREISVTHKPDGRVARISVAVAVRDPKDGKPRSPAELAKIEALVKGAVGFDAARGDVVTVSSRPFAESDVEERGFWEEAWFLPLVRQAGALLAALLVLLFVGRPILRSFKNKETKPDAKESAGEEVPVLAEAPTDPLTASSKITLEMIEAAPSYEARAELVRNYVRQDSERAAMVVRQLMQETTDAS